MSIETAMDRLRAANPAPDTRLLRDQSDDLNVLLSETWQRSTNVQTQQPLQMQEPQKPRRRGWLVAAAAFAVVVVVGLGIGLITMNADNPPASTPTPTTTPPTTTPPTTTPPTTTPPTTAPSDAAATTTTPTVAGPPKITVIATDYAYEGVPASVPVGTVFRMDNHSTDEFHELVFVRIDDDDDRTAEEIMALDLDELFDGDNPTFGLLGDVMLARPDGGSYVVNGVPGQGITNPGRYIVMCLTPVGADPAFAEQRAGDGPPTAEDLAGTVPHYQMGEYAEFIVEG
jgi:hypothetical protein